MKNQIRNMFEQITMPRDTEMRIRAAMGRRQPAKSRWKPAVTAAAVLAMLLRGVYTFLWSLLFLIPGIVKSYAYSMVPYIIYENPNLTAKQAIALSCKLTDGYKWDLFILDLSFIGWNLLSAITGGILGILYVYPYMGVTHATVYEHLKQSALTGGRVTYLDFDQVAVNV